MIVTISGVPGLNGEYRLSGPSLTNREFHIIKELSGLRAMEIDDGLTAGDIDLAVALAVCALYRDGKTHWKETAEQLLDADVGAIRIEPEPSEMEDDALPPAQTPSSQENGAGSEAPAFGGASSSTGASPDGLRSPTGPAHWEHSAT